LQSVYIGKQRQQPRSRNALKKGPKMTTITTASTQWFSRPDDERFVNLIDLNDHCQKLRERSNAKVVANRALEVQPHDANPMRGLQIVGEAKKPAVMTHWSFGQIASLAGAPAGYLRNLPAPIAADALNYGLKFHREVEEIGVLATRKLNEIDLIEIRAATGPRYGRIWNAELTEALVKRFGNGVGDTDWRVPGEFGKMVEVDKANTTLYASDRDMFVFLADEKNRIEMPNRRNGESGSLARGFFVWNSEVGSGTIGAAFFLFDYVCCNRIVWGAEGFKEIRLRHSSGAPYRWLEEIQPVLTEYANASEKPVLETIAAAQEKRIDDVTEFLNKRFTKNIAAKIDVTHSREENRPVETVWDAVTGLTAYAKTIAHQDTRVALEREAGKLLKLAA
jgi:hypothetical protein